VATAPLRSMADVDALLSATGYASMAAFVHRTARLCFHILPDHGAAPALGGSRLGGMPDLPMHARWPAAKDGRLLTFYGQINLDDVAVDGTPTLLPARGLLSIFGGGDEVIEVHAVLSSPEAQLCTLAPGTSNKFADGRIQCLDAVAVRLEAGLSFPTERMHFSRALEAAAPDGDIDAVLAGLAASPVNAIGQFLGYAQFPSHDVHAAVHFSEIGRADQERLEIWEDWNAWEAAKNMQSRLRNGQIYRPWSAADDDNVRWILANRAAIESGVAQWHSLLWISSNPLMNLWLNDADPIYFLARAGEDGRLDLSAVRAGMTQS
jgi:hypothetical protein